jgi:ribosomal protein S27E
MPINFKCPFCERNMGVFEQGTYRCNNCAAVWWGPFDKPTANQQGRGYKCPECNNVTLFYVAEAGKFSIYRCGSCGYVRIEPPEQTKKRE